MALLFPCFQVLHEHNAGKSTGFGIPTRDIPLQTVHNLVNMQRFTSSSLLQLLISFPHFNDFQRRDRGILSLLNLNYLKNTLKKKRKNSNYEMLNSFAAKR